MCTYAQHAHTIPVNPLFPFTVIVATPVAENQRSTVDVSYRGIALQPMEKVEVALDFWWRSGSPLRDLTYFQSQL